jgi:hypothetical protein
VRSHWLATDGGIPAGMGEQVPILPGTSQAMQTPSHAPEQQTPSAQKPLSH